MVKRSTTTPKKEKTKMWTINSNVWFRLEKLWAGAVMPNCTWLQEVRNAKAWLKANTDDFSNYTGSKQAPSRTVWARKEDTGQSDSSQSLAKLQITSTDLARTDCTWPTPLLSMMRLEMLRTRAPHVLWISSLLARPLTEHPHSLLITKPISCRLLSG